MSNNQTHDEEVFTDISLDGSTATRDQECRTCLYDRFPFIEEEYTEERAAEIANWAIKQDIQGFPDKCFGSFVWEMIESKGHDNLLEAQRFFGFMHHAWTKVGKPSLSQIISVEAQRFFGFMHRAWTRLERPITSLFDFMHRAWTKVGNPSLTHIISRDNLAKARLANLGPRALHEAKEALSFHQSLMILTFYHLPHKRSEALTEKDLDFLLDCPVGNLRRSLLRVFLDEQACSTFVVPRSYAPVRGCVVEEFHLVSSCWTSCP